MSTGIPEPASRDLFSIGDFFAAEVRVGRVLKAEPFPEAHKPAYKLHIHFGPDLGELQSSAQVTELYQCSDLVGEQVLAVVNLPARKIAGFESECLVLGCADAEGRIVLVRPAAGVPDGARLH